MGKEKVIVHKVSVRQMNCSFFFSFSFFFANEDDEEKGFTATAVQATTTAL